MALIGETVDGETPLTAAELQGLKLPFVKTRAHLNTVEAANILTAKQWAMRSRMARLPHMLTADFLQALHRRMFGDVWDWAGVKIHPFRNGNGRHSRLTADLVLEKHFNRPPFTWGGNADLGNGDVHRPAYLAALKAADQGNYALLLQLCRSS